MLTYLTKTNSFLFLFIAAVAFGTSGCFVNKNSANTVKGSNYLEKITSAPEISIDKVSFSKFNYDNSVDLILDLRIENKNFIPLPPSEVSLDIFFDNKILGVLDKQKIPSLGANDHKIVPLIINVSIIPFVSKSYEQPTDIGKSSKVKVVGKLSVLLLDFDFELEEDFLPPTVNLSSISIDSNAGKALFDIKLAIKNNTDIDIYCDFDVELFAYNQIIAYSPTNRQKEYFIKAKTEENINFKIIIDSNQIGKTLERTIRNKGLLAYRLKVMYKYGMKEENLWIEDKIKLPMDALLKLNLVNWLDNI